MLAKAAVLCGGEGNRLRPLTNYFQKTMIPVGARRRPILEYRVAPLYNEALSTVLEDDAERASLINSQADIRA